MLWEDLPSWTTKYIISIQLLSTEIPTRGHLYLPIIFRKSQRDIRYLISTFLYMWKIEYINNLQRALKNMYVNRYQCSPLIKIQVYNLIEHDFCFPMHMFWMNGLVIIKVLNLILGISSGKIKYQSYFSEEHHLHLIIIQFGVSKWPENKYFDISTVLPLFFFLLSIQIWLMPNFQNQEE